MLCFSYAFLVGIRSTLLLLLLQIGSTELGGGLAISIHSDSDSGSAVSASDNANANITSTSNDAIVKSMLVNGTATTVKNITIAVGRPSRLTLSARERVNVSAVGFADDVGFVIFHAHSHHHRVSVSLDAAASYSKTAVGQDVGVATVLTAGQTRCTWYLTSLSDSAIVVTVIASAYLHDDPLPGGCNMEFDLENDPNVLQRARLHAVSVRFQYANAGSLAPELCQDQNLQAELIYDVYQRFLKEGDSGDEQYLGAVNDMLRVDDVVRYSTKVATVRYNDGLSVRAFVAFPGQGVFYAVVVRQQGTNRSALYVPVFTWVCMPGMPSCPAANALIIWHTVIVSLGIVGLFICIAGHRFFKFEMLAFGYIAAHLLSYLIIHRFTSLTTGACLATSICIGITGGALWLLLWWYVGFAELSVLLGGLLMGYLAACFLFNMTPFGQLDVYAASEWAYAVTFTCAVLILPVILLTKAKLLNLISCAVVGSFLAVFAVDYFVDGSLHLAVLVSVWRATDPAFHDVVISIPFQINDIILVSVWGCLAVAGTTYQWIRERDRPDPRPAERGEHAAPQRHLVDTAEASDEHEPLLSPDDRYHSYLSPVMYSSDE